MMAGSYYTATVEVYCHEPSHSRWVVERFARMRGDGEWLVLPGVLDADTRLRRPEGTRAYIDRDTNVRAGYKGFSPPFTPRDRYNLQCDKCGLTVAVRAENLAPIFDALAAHGVSSISLKGLAARLAS